HGAARGIEHVRAGVCSGGAQNCAQSVGKALPAGRAAPSASSPRTTATTRRTTLIPNNTRRSESRPLVYPHVQWARMGKVVKLDAAAKERGKSASASKQRKTGRRRRSKTALVLGGGGFTGGVYEIGALRALDLLSVNRTVNQFDVYVGTSAGSMIAAMTANG